MRVFLAGATGVIGRRLVPMLLEGGHEVVGMSRSEERAQGVRELGAEAVVCDAFDAEGLSRAVREARPEVVIHQLTDIPKAVNPRKMEEQFEGNDRLRVEGTRNLVAAAQAAGARRLVSQSIAFAYAPGDTLRSEDDPLFLDGPGSWPRTAAAVEALESQTLSADALEGVVLRYGWFYGPGSAYASDGSSAHMVRKRAFPIIGGGGAVYSFIHIDDAAAATVAALDGSAAGVFNVVDDEPARVRDWLPEYAAALGAPSPRKAPKFLARVAAGRLAVYMMTGLQGATNEKARRELGFTPRFASWRQGFKESLG